MSEYVQVEDLIYHFSTDEAICVSIEEDTFGNEAERIFMPKSKLKEFETFQTDDNTLCVIELPEWLATEKGLI